MRFTAPLWEYGGQASWYFVTLPPELSDDLREQVGRRRGFGSIRVRATVGATTWTTSVFPSKTEGYLLPVKRAVRVAEQLDVDEPVDVALDVLD